MFQVIIHYWEKYYFLRLSGDSSVLICGCCSFSSGFLIDSGQEGRLTSRMRCQLRISCCLIRFFSLSSAHLLLIYTPPLHVYNDNNNVVALLDNISWITITTHFYYYHVCCNVKTTMTDNKHGHRQNASATLSNDYSVQLHS